MRRLPWIWPAGIIISALAAGLATLILPGTIVGTIVIMWFLFICPGMTVIHSLDLDKPAIEWTLALALSFVIDAIVSGIQLYVGQWSPTLTLSLLIGLCLFGGFVQLVSSHPVAAKVANQFVIFRHILLERKNI